MSRRRPPPPPPPPGFVRVFSGQDGVGGERAVWIGGCLLGLLVLSLVAGGWRLMRAAKRSQLEVLRQTDFVSNISHEFKTPLTTICLCAELAQDEEISAKRRMTALKAIYDESERLKRLVLNALDFGRLEAHRRQYVMRRADVAEIARETCRSFSARFETGLLTGPEGTCEANVDIGALSQILTNLLDNAAKYAGDRPVAVTVSKEGERTFVRVSDQGPGLDRQALRHAFDRFWRGDNSVTRETGGSGLGLCIARNLARGMGGDLTCANGRNGGAVFTLEVRT